MKMQKVLHSKKGSVLIWVMVALLVVSLLTAVALQITSRYYNTTTERHVDSQTYHSAYSLALSISTWIKSYDPANLTSANQQLREETEAKRDFIEALKDDPITIDANSALNADQTTAMGTCEAVVTLTQNTDNNAVARIDIVATAERQGRKNTVSALLEGGLTNDDVIKNTTFDDSFEPDDFGMPVNVISEISGVLGDWPEIAKIPAYMGRTGVHWRYWTIHGAVYDATNPQKPVYMTVNPLFAGGPGINKTDADANIPTPQTTNRYIYYSRPSIHQGSTGALWGGDFSPPPTTPSNRDFFRLQDGLPTGKVSDTTLDLRVLLNPGANMLDTNYFDLRGLMPTTGIAIPPDSTSPIMPLGQPNYFGGQTSVPKWLSSSAFDNTATLLHATGLENVVGIPAARFTYFTDPDYYNLTEDVSYILARHLESGRYFNTTAVVTSPWTTYHGMYIYLTNESNDYFQITGAVESEGGAIYTVRDFIIGGKFLEKYVGPSPLTANLNRTEWDHLGLYPTQLEDMQMYFASPTTSTDPKYNNLRKTKVSKIQGTGGASSQASVDDAKPTLKTRIDGGWIVVQNNHELTITDTLINTQKRNTVANVSGADAFSNGSSSRIVTGGHTSATQFSTILNIPDSGGQVVGKQSGNDIYVSTGGKLTLGNGALVCSDIYVDPGATLVIEGNAAIYGNIYSNGTVEVRSKDARVYGKNEANPIDPDETITNGDDAGKQASGIFVYSNKTNGTRGNIIISSPEGDINVSNIGTIFPQSASLTATTVNGVHTFVLPYDQDSTYTLQEVAGTSTLIKALEGNTDPTADPICTHFKGSANTSWYLIRMDGK